MPKTSSRTPSASTARRDPRPETLPPSRPAAEPITAEPPTRPVTPDPPRTTPGEATGTAVGADITATAQPVIVDAATVGESVQDRVWEAVRRNPGATSTELAERSKVVRSTVVQLLETWTEEGSITVAPGPHARSAKRWTAKPPTITFAPSSTPDPELTATTDVGDATPKSVSDTAPADPQASRPDAPQTAESRAANHTSLGSKAGRGVRPSEANRSGSKRLRSGALQGLVEDFLAEHPGEHGPTAISHAIGRSQGAIANALERLVSSGWAERTNEAPKRYRIATGTDIRQITVEAGVSVASDPDPNTDTREQSNAKSSSTHSERAGETS